MLMVTNGRDVKNGGKSLVHSIPAESERFAFESQVRECFGRAAYSHKTHEKMADRCAGTLGNLKNLQILLSALTASGAIGTLFADQPWVSYATIGVSVATLLLNGYAKDIDPGAVAQRHREAASDIWDVREAYLSLLTDIRDSSISLGDLRQRRDSLQDKLHRIYRSAPHTDSKAYGKAQKALQQNEELTFSDEEIDVLLPKPLRRTS